MLNKVNQMATKNSKVAEVKAEVKSEEKKGPGRQAGPGAITAGKDKYPEFQKIWNSAAETESDVKVKIGDKEIGGAMALILTNLRKAKIANENTDPSQVRAFATKVRDSGLELHQFVVRLDKFKCIRAWNTSNSPEEAFEKAVKLGVFENFTVEQIEDCDEKELKSKKASFRAVIKGLEKKKVPLKKLGRGRSAKIDDEKFIAAWKASESVAEVKEKLLAQKAIEADCKLATLKSKFNTLRKAGEDLKKLASGEGLSELMKFAQSVLEDENIEAPEAEEGEEYEDGEEEDEEEEEEEEDGDENLDLDDVLG